MDFISAILGTTLDEVYQRLIDCIFGIGRPGAGHYYRCTAYCDGKRRPRDHPAEVVSILALGDSSTAERSRKRLVRWRCSETSGYDLAREPGLGEKKKSFRLGDMPMPVRPCSLAQPLFGSKRLRNGPAPPHSVDSPTAAPTTKKAGMMMSSYFPTIDEKDETHQMMMEIEPLLIEMSYLTWRNILLIHGKHPCHCLLQTFWYPKRANLVLFWDAGNFFSMRVPDQAQNMTRFVVSAMLAVR